MKAIGLITDFGLQDNFVGVMKAAILKINPRSAIVDICHNVKPQNVREAAFLLKNSYKYFPKGSVFAVVVDPQVGSKRRGIIARTKDYFFVGPDNGVLSLALKEDKPLDTIEITNEEYLLKPVSNTFHGRDVFSPVAAYLSRKEPLEGFGRKIRSITELELSEAKVTPQEITGEIIYIDRFGNLITNITEDALRKFVKGKEAQVYLNNTKIGEISRSYCERPVLSPLALIGSFGCLEIALNCGCAKDYFGVQEGKKVKVKRLA